MIYRLFVLIILLVFLLPPGYITYAVSSATTTIKNDEERIIGNIYINNIDVSGPDINDGNDWQPDIFGKIGNALHIKTKPWVIRNILLFKKGQRLDPQTIEDSERLLRETGYFYDARIIVENSDTPGTVNIIVTTKDKWTLNPRLAYSPKNRNGYFGISDKNLLGVGHSAGISINRSDDPYLGWGGNFDYTVNNIKGSFVDAYLNLSSNNKSNLFRMGLSRAFITAATQWAGGLEFTWQHDDFRYLTDSGSTKLIPNSYDLQDLWVGRSFPVLFGTKIFKRNTSFILSGRYYRKHYSVRPEVTAESNRIFENHRLYLVSTGILNRYFYKSFYINEFGITEDIPVGGMITLTTGSDSREFYNRWYYGLQVIYSEHLVKSGYFSGKFELGGFRHSGRWEQNTIKFSMLYHSPLLRKNNWKARLFLQNNYVRGLNRFEGEQLYLDRSSGMAGFNKLDIAGIKRNVLDLELRLFTPYNVLGFIIGGIVFANYGLIAGHNKNLLNSRVYQGYGLGFRTKNESISQTNFELALVYNPNYPSSGRGNTEITFSASIILGSRNFNFNKPEIIDFTNN